MAATVETQEVRAEAKWVRTSPRKARLVAEHIRGRSVPEARTVLAFTPRAAARELEKVLRSAIANAEANHGLIGDELYVKVATVDEGPTLKRWRARARGRVGRIRKRTCHITVRLAPIPEEPARTVKAAEPAAPEEKGTVKTEKAAPKAEKKPAEKKSSAAKSKTSRRPKKED
jgi:ribosomal protein L22